MGEDRRLGKRYVLEERIGRGAMGSVWRARNTDTGEAVAIKILAQDCGEDPEILARFVQERSVLLGLRHSNLVTVQNMVVEDERLALVMDLIPGGDLQRTLRERGALAPAEVADLGGQICAALHAIHTAGIVHRDLKPANVLLDTGTRPPTARLADFGVARIAGGARITARTSVIGTPAYLAPELIRCEDPVPASDLYALGITLYELLTGRPPFDGGPVMTLLQRHLHEAPARHPAIPDSLWTVIEACLRKDPRERPDAATAAALLHRSLTVLPTMVVSPARSATVDDGPAGSIVPIPRPRAGGFPAPQARFVATADLLGRGSIATPPTGSGPEHAPDRRDRSFRRQTSLLAAAVAAVLLVGGAIAFAVADKGTSTLTAGSAPAGPRSSPESAVGGGSGTPASTSASTHAATLGRTGTATAGQSKATTTHTTTGAAGQGEATATHTTTGTAGQGEATPTGTGTAVSVPSVSPTSATPTPVVNLALNAPVTVSSVYSGDEYFDWGPQDTTNGDFAPSTTSMGWSSTSHATPDATEWLSVDLGTQDAVDEVDLYPRNDSGGIGDCFPVDFTIAVSTNDTTWTTVVTESGYPRPGNGAQRFPFSTVTARYIKATGTVLAKDQFNGYFFQLKQIVVYNP